MSQELCFGQRVDPELGILEPWYTNPAMDVIKKWDLSGKMIWEWGSGNSSIWWAKKARGVISKEHDINWYHKMLELRISHNVPNLGLSYVDTHEGDQSGKRDEYVKEFYSDKPSICIVDGVHRYECIEYAYKKTKPQILIIDNWQQDYVFICPAAEELLKDVKREIYIQPDHKDHSGNAWATAIFYL